MFRRKRLAADYWVPPELVVDGTPIVGNLVPVGARGATVMVAAVLDQ